MWLNHTDLASYANEAADSFTVFLFKQEENWIKANVTWSLLAALGNKIHYHQVNHFLNFNQEIYVY